MMDFADEENERGWWAAYNPCVLARQRVSQGNISARRTQFLTTGWTSTCGNLGG